jgi:hypothetical protein
MQNTHKAPPYALKLGFNRDIAFWNNHKLFGQKTEAASFSPIYSLITDFIMASRQQTDQQMRLSENKY